MIKGFIVCTVILMHVQYVTELIYSWPQEGAPPIPRALREAAKAKLHPCVNFKFERFKITATASP